jgi:D-sedoheptulose 7-phosphate isomerase
MEKDKYVRWYLNTLADILTKMDDKPLTQAVEWIRECGEAGKMIYSCGNGGSALIASQLVGDMVKQASIGREKRFKMIGLTDSVGTMLAYGNDVDFGSIFVEPLKNFAEEGDILLGVSGSGNSENVIRAFEYANSIGCKTIGLTTANGGKLREISNLALEVPSDHMGHLEDAFFIMTHILCYAFIDKAF